MTTSDTRRAAAVLAAAALAVAVVGEARPARAADDLPPAILGGRPPAPNLWQLAAGLRVALIRDSGFDPFATDDMLPQLALSLTRVLARPNVTGGIVPAVGVAWDTGERRADARGTEARLSLHRLSVVLEARWVPRRGAHVTARLSPGLLRAAATLDDTGAPAPLETRFWAPSVDAAVGGAVRLTPDVSPLGFWLVADVGYGWAPAHDLVLRPKLADADADKAGATSLGRLALQGAFMRAGIALSY